VQGSGIAATCLIPISVFCLPYNVADNHYFFQGLFPAILNLASNAHISTNATCGEKGPEMFCKLVEHVPGRPLRNAQCRVCDHHSANPKEQHPISSAIDGTNNWWQSPSIQNGRQYHWVTITLDLRQVFQVAYVIIKAANAPRPGNWILERSIDGTDFRPWQYYAISDTECLTRYNITPRIGPPTYKRDDEVICTSYYSRLVPLEHGEIHTSLINGRPSADDPSQKLLEFTSARYIRLRLQRIRTLNADLMTLSHNDPKELDPIVTRRYYYSVKDISVGGMCICYGHARSCPLDEITKKLQCQCEHNTCGESCNKCCPGYHQKPWRPGTISAGNKCEKCNCHNKAEDCYYNQSIADQKRSMDIHGQYIGGGVCLNCTQHTTGINCEMCAAGYFRPHKVSPYEDHPCYPCGCDPFGAVSSDCVKDEHHSDSQRGTWPGQCQCREGYTGEKCDRCAFGYRDYPNCLRCNCSLIGSINEDPCTEPCLCKENVEGENCDLCKPGFYNLQERNPQGCTECFCFGVSDVCDSLTWPISQVFIYMTGWLVTDLYNARRVQPQRSQFDGPRQISINNTEAVKVLTHTYYWSAPETYLGNKLTAFGGDLKYTVSYDIPMESVDSDIVSSVDVIIQGNGQILSTRAAGTTLQPYEEYSNAVRFVAENFIDFNTKKAIDRERLMTVLVNVTHLLIRANYNIAKKAVYRLDSVTLDTAGANVIDLSSAPDVEFCECPQGYTGISCESCLPGYYRVDGILFGGICQPCKCNGHAAECDIHGVCFACQHNTTGPFCDQCLPGFYGIPSQGTSEDCQPCACPLSSAANNFSPTCQLSEGGEIVCDNCLPGYTGSQCERCANGYYGNPLMPGQSCTPCECSGNVNPQEDGYCDTFTGQCLKCLGNTAGHHCEKCADGYYGDAVIEKSCRACACHVNGSLSSTCHHETGFCHCKSNVIGERCDKCLNGYYGLLAGLGCIPCNCSQFGSVSEDCNHQGQCHCVPGVAGEKCDRCARGFHAFQDGGCTPCDCAHTQNNCNADSGQCICPPHTRGPKCELCEENHWGLSPKLGCKACNCSNTGSTHLQCDVLTGQCQCKIQFGGQDCSRCALGYRDYPDCVACDCDLSGTKAEMCDDIDGLCGCEEETGICTCKENVFGLHCSECKPGTFALSANNALGCTPCFCFGMSTSCSELEDHVTIPITLTPDQSILHVVSQSNLTGTVEGVFSQYPDVLLDAAVVRKYLNTETFYWRLPEQFQGDQLMAYGGKLRYTVAFYALDGFGTSNFEPQILMKGGHTSKLVIYVDSPSPENGVRTDKEVEMKEDSWKYFNSVSDEPVLRSDFMSVLSNVEYILIKAAYGQGLQQSRIANISMEVAVKFEEMHQGRARAHLVEQCRCPAGYAGLSCQSCAPGYYRGKHTELSVQEPHTLIAPCVPCQCNNHSETCDPETGRCLNCRDNTVGDYCSACAPGYYGKVIGSVKDCSLCACPRANPISFSPTCVLKGVQDYHCDACLPGYEGQYCESCSLGYYGDPQLPGGSCHPCMCNPSGSVHVNCDRATGQCFCKQGVTGQLCEECEPRHLLVEDECVSCDDNCTGVLLNSLDNLNKAILSVNLSGVASVPYGILSELENATKLSLSPFIYFLIPFFVRAAKKLLIQVQTEYLKPQQELVDLKKDANQLLAKHNSRLQDAQDLVNEALANINETNRLFPLISSNLAELNVIYFAIEKVRGGYFVVQNLEVDQDGLVLWSTKLRHHVDELVMQMSVRGVLDLVYKAEDHATQNQERFTAVKYMLDVKELAVSANTSAVVGLSHFGDFSQKLLNTSSTLSRVNDTLRKTSELITDSSKAAEKQVKEVEAQASLLLDRLKPLKMLEENLNRNLSEIKELISQARKQAASIKVAVSADRDCIRAYQPQISSTNYNTLTLNVKTAEPDNLLFYLGSNGKTDFLAVEMRRGKVALLWDLGSGSTRVEYPDFQIDNNKWHRIHATRFGKTGTLSIEEMNSNQKPSSKSATSPGTASILDVNKSTLMFIGGLGGQIKKSPAVKVTHFKGCMGEASLNGKSIGLWNYMEREGKCNGCFGSPQDEDTSFHFDGSGYSVVEKALRSTVTQIIIFFSTYSPNGLLLYLASNGTRDFLSLELVDGKVRLTVDLGSGPLALTTENRYNNGTWYKISFSRNKKQGILAVMDAYNLNYKETKQGESPGVASDLNRSDKDPIFIGGLPSLALCFRKGLNSRMYVGCIKNLEISRSTFDLLRNSYGVRKGCVLEPIRSVNILNNGYIELVPKSLSPESELMATFATKNSSGIILAGLSRGLEKRRRRQAHLPFFSIMLIDGHLAVYVNAGDRASTRKVILQAANGTYSDGQEHSVILIRNKRIITVQVDESNPAELRLGSSAEMSPVNISNFYAGGIPAGEGILGLKMAGSFHGCISNLIFNKELLYFTTSMKYEHVDMDSCFLSEKPKPTTQPEGIEIQLQALPVVCAKDEIPDHVQGAHQFGLAKGSHLTLLFNQSMVRKKLSVQLNLRTFASSGLIYYMAHQNQVDYAALQLHGGQLYFSFDLGKGKAVAFHSAFISDGKWHTIKTEYVKRKGIIIVDGQELVAVSALGDGSTLDVEGKLYVGGLPLDYVPKNLGNVTHSIPACIGNMTINSKQLDDKSPISIFAVNKCYVTVQDGTFFDGSGFAALVREGYKVRSDVNITLEFRTTAVHGVLLGVSSAKVDAIGLEIVNGKVLFHVNNGAGRMTAMYEPRGTNSLCDGKWHKLQANKSKHRISLIIDGNLVQTDNPYIQSTSADTNNPIYVGGYPADVKQNCLTSKISFHGCLRNLVLTKGQQAELFDFSRAFDLRGVFPHSCPGAEH
uniref:Laminin subunit alpha-1 n=1 Tax=Athene cunicularia TaxID=194338 RepID=A0A663M6Q6_ATHCN